MGLGLMQIFEHFAYAWLNRLATLTHVGESMVMVVFDVVQLICAVLKLAVLAHWFLTKNFTI